MAAMLDTPFPSPATARWADQIRTAAAEQRPLRLRGGDSKAFYGEPMPGSLIELDTREYTGVMAYGPSELVITARAGTPLAELESLLADQGQCLAFEPPHFGDGATVGGMVAAGLSGPARASVGSVRDFVLGARLLNGRGEHLTFGGQVMKNVAGYDVSRLLAGSLGSLGVITEVSLKVLPVAPAEATLCFELPQAEALQQLARWRGQPLPLNASCWVHDTTATPARDLLFVRLRGAVAAVEAACTHMLQDAPGERMDTLQTAADWVACREQTLPFFAQPPSPEHGLWRLSVAPTAPELPLPGSPLVEWHGGLRWVWAPTEARTALQQTARQAGGHATLFRAPAKAPETPGRFTPPAAHLQTIQQRLKAEFDPAGIFNPGRWGFGL
jgi:glycolate oxidase FAD binding subunit